MSSEIDQIVHLIKNLARDEIGHTQSSYFGYVSSYDKQTGAIQLRIPQLRNGDNSEFVTPPIPLGTWMSGNGFGFQYWPAVGTPCEMKVVSKDGGSSIAGVLLYNDKFLPPFAQDVNFSENDFGFQHKSGSYGVFFGSVITFSAVDRLVLQNSVSNKNVTITAGTKPVVSVNGGSIPVAVEGSTVTHYHGLAALFSVLATEITTYTTANPPSGASMGTTDLAAIFAAVATTLATGASGTDIAGNSAFGGLTPAAVDAGQGAQDFVAPSPGGN